MSGKLVLSLDLELYWGVSDSIPFDEYRWNVEQVHEVAPRVLDLLAKYDVKLTWAAIGFAMARDVDELMTYLPETHLRPTYSSPGVSNYRMLDTPELKKYPKAFFAEKLMRQILSCPGQELGSHSLSHFYCQEAGQTREQFRADLQSAKKMAMKFNHRLESYVFPRNQFNAEYLKVLVEEGFRTYRGNPDSYCYSAEEVKSPLKRIIRLVDRHLPVVGGLTHELNFNEQPVNVPASLFMAPVTGGENFWSKLRLSRLFKLMDEAAQSHRVVHFWCHPHNLSKNSELNLKNLESIFKHYKHLHERYGFESHSMKTVLATKSERACA